MPLYTGQAVQNSAYDFGIQAFRIARLVLIAEMLNEDTLAEQGRTWLRTNLVARLANGASNPLNYDQRFGGVITNLGITGNVNNGVNGLYDGHHYDYGYFVYAAAVLGKNDAAFLTANTDALVALVRDYASPSATDQFFIQARQKDWYAGNSWSNGLKEDPFNRFAQSVSEAVNAYHAVVLLGTVLNDQELVDWGRLLLAHEIRGL